MGCVSSKHTKAAIFYSTNVGIKTRHGCFRPYTGTEDSKLEGTGQGSGASPAIWLLYCDSLLQAFQKFTKGISIVRPFDNLTRTIPAIFYVDDGTPGVNDMLSDTAMSVQELLSEGQKGTILKSELPR